MTCSKCGSTKFSKERSTKPIQIDGKPQVAQKTVFTCAGCGQRKILETVVEEVEPLLDAENLWRVKF